ncbi:hypothetical protein PoB_003748100 [Plakobranchus ocellatus]|uniref:Altered inheritance of mitochondria protein 24, mitochondrial n=1 Tax=Plakobranchus ocellatus TaxID=259542 RepID=A0AAV4AII6_9GAST|nr:hypothetical protein PoB_003748100 [Plakobranchus ocellatus]
MNVPRLITRARNQIPFAEGGRGTLLGHSPAYAFPGRTKTCNVSCSEVLHTVVRTCRFSAKSENRTDKLDLSNGTVVISGTKQQLGLVSSHGAFFTSAIGRDRISSLPENPDAIGSKDGIFRMPGGQNNHLSLATDAFSTQQPKQQKCAWSSCCLKYDGQNIANSAVRFAHVGHHQ